jgi:hypothetical protein
MVEHQHEALSSSPSIKTTTTKKATKDSLTSELILLAMLYCCQYWSMYFSPGHQMCLTVSTV